MTKHLPVLRPSALPAAFTCPGSAQPVDVEISPVSPPADEGTAGHAVMKAIVDADLSGLGGLDIRAIAARHSVDAYDLKILGYIGLRVWKEVRESFVNAQAEVELKGMIEVDDGRLIELIGHPDAFALDHRRKRANLADWKFGRVDRDHVNQIKGYAFLVFENYPSVQEVLAFVGWMRDGEVETYVFTREDIETWVEELRTTIADWDGVYHPGPQCAHCRVSTACPAWRAMARRDVEIITGPEMAEAIGKELADMAPADVVDIRRRAKAVEKVLKDLDQAIKLRVRAAGGDLDAGNGWELRIKQETRESIDVEKAWPVLEKELSEAELTACVEIHKSKVEDAVANKAPRGEKTREKERVIAALKAVDALIPETREKLQYQRKRGDR